MALFSFKPLLDRNVCHQQLEYLYMHIYIKLLFKLGKIFISISETDD